MDATLSTKPAGMRRIRSKEDGIGIFSSWVQVIIYCAFAFWMFYVFAIVDKNVIGGLISGFFAVFGVVYIVLAVHLTLNRLKYGQVVLNLPVEKPVLGGEVVGSLVLPKRAAQVSKVRVELRCLKMVFSTNSKGRTTRKEKREWYDERFFLVRRSGARRQVEFRMKVPDEPVISRAEDYIWEVQVVADVPGVDLSRSFIFEVDRYKSAPPAVAERGAAPADRGFAPAQAFSTPKAVLPTVQPQAAPVSAAAVAPVTGSVARPAATAVKTAATNAEPESAMPVVALIAANMVPLAGVIFLAWKVGDIVLLYWLENVVIGVMNLARIVSAQPDALTRNAPRGKRLRPHELLISKLFLSGFFLVHYGAFCAAHATFLPFLFSMKGTDGRSMDIAGMIGNTLSDPGMLATVLALFASHLISYLRNYLGRGEYRQADIAQLMVRPYGRIVVVHLFIIAGGTLVTFLKSPMIAMALFVIIKTAVDLHMHRRERTLQEQ